VNAKLNEVDISKDQELFMNLNIRTFVAPDDWKFEPSPIHYDTVSGFFEHLISYLIGLDNKADMNTDPSPKIVLQNKLRRSKEKLAELDDIVNSAREWFSRSQPCVDHLTFVYRSRLKSVRSTIIILPGRSLCRRRR
jgi:hypothetical protein